MANLTPPNDSDIWVLPDGRIMNKINGKWKHKPGDVYPPGSLLLPEEYDTPVPLNEWIGDKRVWCYRCNFGQAPNSTIKTVPHPQVVLDMLPSKLSFSGTLVAADGRQFDVNVSYASTGVMYFEVTASHVRYTANVNSGALHTDYLWIRFLRNDQ